MTAQQAETSDKTAQPVPYHWVMTVQYDRGRSVATYDGPVSVVPGVHTHTSTYNIVRQYMQEQVGTDQFNVLHFSVNPDRF